MNTSESTAFEKACIGRAMVVPHWLPGSSSLFWYKQTLPLNKWQFIFVDCEKRICRPAFDHEALASHLGEAVDAKKLPLGWLNVDPEGVWVRFQYKGKTWQLKDGKLAQWEGEFDMRDVEMGRDVTTPTPRTAKGKTDLQIANLTEEALSYYWINHDGNSDWRIGVIPARDSVRLGSPVGYRFRVESRSGKTIVLEINRKTGIANIEDTPDGLLLWWQQDPLTDAALETPAKVGLGDKPENQVFIRKHNLWSRKDGVERQVSYNGFEDDSFGSASASPDGRFAVATQTRSGSAYPMELKNSVPVEQFRPKIKKSANGPGGVHRRAGDHLPTDRPRLFDLAKRCEVPTDDSLFRNPYQVLLIGWSECGTKYRFIFNERGHKHLRLLEIGLDGDVRLLVDEASHTVVDYNQKLWYKFVPETKDILWMSERDGWNHLYRFSEDGSLQNQITKGEWVVRSVEYVDVKERKIWFKACGIIRGQDPYYLHLACVDFDGSNLRCITREDGTHVWKFGPGRRFIIDSWSRVDLVPKVSVIDAANPKQAMFLHHVEQSPDERETYSFPERFAAKGRDGKTDIYGVIVRPSNFDPTKTYPIMDVIYAHPFQCITPKPFKTFAVLRKATEPGYVAVIIDGMGTNWRSKAFRDVSYKNTIDAGLPDHIAWIQAAAKTRSWMDITRVGIQGASAGGHNAASAVLHHGSFYKAAVAEAAYHDPRLGTARWEEMYLGWPVDASYEENSNSTHAKKLTGALMLCTGEMDDVVDPASTMQFADALIKTDKDFDLVIVPDDTHYASSDWLAKKKARFFKRYLLDGEESPNAAPATNPSAR
ncbi:hypothetical protein NQ176_g8134 [Zarea fungicola]|uniref:Uncharacterized protein n=1 Tax=Zarea fungicola TaxID=93591 RepID=A0ACC1MUM9_9HYPO|nr:hypothetical protein NQ176_g8134 [Lecanicillium fungicola]